MSRLRSVVIAAVAVTATAMRPPIQRAGGCSPDAVRRARDGASVARYLHTVDCLLKIIDHSDHRLIRLVGRLTAAQVHELLEASHSGRRSVRLNLRELISVDAVGLEALLDLQQDGARLLEVPAYIQLKLDSLSSKRGKRRG